MSRVTSLVIGFVMGALRSRLSLRLEVAGFAIGSRCTGGGPGVVVERITGEPGGQAIRFLDVCV